jgi:hypothetical protein
LALGLSWVLVPALARAQEAPSAVAPPAEGPVHKLAYKYRPGTVHRYRYTTRGTLILDISRLIPPGAIGQIPTSTSIDLASEYDLILKIKSVDPEDSAVVEITVDNMVITGRGEGRNAVARLRNGKLSVTRDGQPYPLKNLKGTNPFAGKTFSARVAATGYVMERRGNWQDALREAFGDDPVTSVFPLTFGMPDVGLLVLPAESVPVGAAWDEPEPVPLPRPAGAARARIEARTRNTLTMVQQKGIRRVAVIDSAGESVVPQEEIRGAHGGPVTLEGGKFTVVGTSYFDIGSGELRMGEYTVRLKLDAPLALVGAPPGGSVRIEGGLSGTVNVQSSEPARPAPARAGTGRRGE